MTEHDYDALSVVLARIVQHLGALAHDLETFMEEFRKAKSEEEEEC
jgi:hypothetical protein